MLLALIDLRHRLLPDRVVLPSIAVGAVLLGLAAALEGDWAALLRAAVAAVVLFVVFLVMALISPAGLGMGDVKLAALLGLYLGWLGWNVGRAGRRGRVRRPGGAGPGPAGHPPDRLAGELPFGPAMLARRRPRDRLGRSPALLG